MVELVTVNVPPLKMPPPWPDPSASPPRPPAPPTARIVIDRSTVQSQRAGAEGTGRPPACPPPGVAAEAGAANGRVIVNRAPVQNQRAAADEQAAPVAGRRCRRRKWVRCYHRWLDSIRIRRCSGQGPRLPH